MFDDVGEEILNPRRRIPQFIRYNRGDEKVDLLIGYSLKELAACLLELRIEHTPKDRGVGIYPKDFLWGGFQVDHARSKLGPPCFPPLRSNHFIGGGSDEYDSANDREFEIGWNPQQVDSIAEDF